MNQPELKFTVVYTRLADVEAAGELGQQVSALREQGNVIAELMEAIGLPEEEIGQLCTST